MKVKKIIKNIIYFLLNYFFIFKSYPNKGVILMYHSVGNNKMFFNVKKNNFIKQMEYLKKNEFKIITLKQLIEFIKQGKIIHKKTVILTFDDGYEDNYLNIWPILKKYNFQATIFLIPDLIGKITHNKQNISFKMLNWSQILEMHQSGLIDFQSHSLTHQKLGKINLEQMKNEIKESKEIIEKRLNKNCYFFSYPNGDFNETVINILKENNFKAALTINNGLVNGNLNLFKLPRKSINSETNMVQFKGKLKFNLKFLK